MITTLVVLIGLLLLVGLVGLIFLWTVTEELPRVTRVPYYERREAGMWEVRLLRVGRRKSRALRIINEVLGGDLARAKHVTEHPPAQVIEGISEALAREVVADLVSAGAAAEAVENRPPNNSGS